MEGDREEREGEIEDSFAKEFSVADTFYKSILTIKIRPSYRAYTIYAKLHVLFSNTKFMVICEGLITLPLLTYHPLKIEIKIQEVSLMVL